MSSHTENMMNTEGSVHCGSNVNENSQQENRITPKRKKSPKFDPEDEEDINNMLKFVPKINQVFKIQEKIGEGTFSSVYLASLKEHPEVEQLFALKHIIPTSHPSRIEQELKCLQLIGGTDNVMGVECCIREKDHVVIVMPYFPHDRFQDYLQRLSTGEIQDYMRNLLISLSKVHKSDIIHRDVKPSNFLYNRKHKQYALVDFGLAHEAPVLLRKKSSDDNLPKKRSRKSLDENQAPPGSPSKKQRVEQNKATKLTEINNQIKEGADTSPNPAEVVKPGYRTFKSPRRAAMVKRAMLVSKTGTEKLLDSKRTFARAPTMALFKSKTDAPTSCGCYDTPSVCSLCVGRSHQVAPRAGTPGYRAPEVLMKCPDQSTAVDMWSAGVILLSLLTRRYPFFRANDDMTALSQIISVLGTDTVRNGAKAFGKSLVCHPQKPNLDLKVMCTKLSKGCPNKDNKNQVLPDSAYDLLQKLLDVNPSTRITAEDGLKHPFFSETL